MRRWWLGSGLTALPGVLRERRFACCCMSKIYGSTDSNSLNLYVMDCVAEMIAAMKHGVILINTARGALVDDDAMIDALRSGHIRHAGLDVYTVEPMPAGHVLTTLENVTLLCSLRL